MAVTKALTSLFLVSLALQGALAAPTDPQKGDIEILPFPRNGTDKFPHPHKPHVKLPGNVHKETPPVKNETEHGHKDKGPKDKDRKPWAGQFGNVHKETPWPKDKNDTDHKPHKGGKGRKPHEHEARTETHIPHPKFPKNETDVPKWPHKKPKWGKGKGKGHHDDDEE